MVKSGGAVWKCPISEAAWKAEKEREGQERDRAERKRVAAAARDEVARQNHRRG